MMVIIDKNNFYQEILRDFDSPLKINTIQTLLYS